MKLRFEKIVIENILDHYIVWNKKKQHLGDIYYEKIWKKWVWQQEEDVIMSDGCLKQVVEVLEKIKEKD